MNVYKVLLVYTILSLLFCLIVPLHAAINYVRLVINDIAWYMPSEDVFVTDNDDAPIVAYITIPSLIIIFATFIHYLLIPIMTPECHHPKILPIFFFKQKAIGYVGKILSYLCIYTMPVLIPIGIAYVYKTSMEGIHTSFIYLFPAFLLMGAGLFVLFYMIFFARMIVMNIREMNGLYNENDDEWFVY